jgi:hypothetical protein
MTSRKYKSLYQIQINPLFNLFNCHNSFKHFATTEESVPLQIPVERFSFISIFGKICAPSMLDPLGLDFRLTFLAIGFPIHLTHKSQNDDVGITFKTFARNLWAVRSLNYWLSV